MSQQLTFNLDVDNKQAIDSINTFFDAFDAGVKDVGKKMDSQFKEKNVNIEMRLEGGKLVAKEINNAASAGNKLEKAMKVVNGKFGTTAKEVNNAVTLLKGLVAETSKYKEGTKELSEDWKRLVTRLREARKEAKDFEVSDQPERSITGANIAAGLALDAIRGLIGGVRNLVSEGIEMEVLMIQLKGFTGSAEEAEIAFNDFLKVAAATPFNVKQIAEAWRTMRGFGVSTEEAKHRTEQLAIVASATGGELNHMARNLGQISANQRAYTRDLMQFANQGIPIYQMLGDVMGMTTQQVREMAEEGKIGFTEVAAALDLMTQEGSAFREIAEEMDKTIAARLEALQGQISATAGKFIQMIQEMDTAMGGPVEKTFKFIIDQVEKIGELFDAIRNNAQQLAPVFGALGAVIATTLGLAFIQNLALIKQAFTAWIVKIMATEAAMRALSIAKAILVALSGNILAIAGVAAIAAGAVMQFGQKADAADQKFRNLNDSLEDEQFSANVDASKQLAFQLDNLDGKTKDYIKTKRKEYTDDKKHYDLAVAQMNRAMAYLEQKAEEEKQHHEKNMEDLKAKIELEKTGQRETLSEAKEVFNQKMTMLREELQAVRDRYDAELSELDKQSIYAKELEQIRRRELEQKLAAGDLSRKEALEIREQLHQMDNKVERRAILARKAEEEEGILKKISSLEKEHADNVKQIKAEYESRITQLEEAYRLEESAVKRIVAELEIQATKVQQFKAEEKKAIFENRDAAITAINDQIVAAGRLRRAMEAAYNEARKANLEAAKKKASSSSNSSNNPTAENFAGGGIAAGTTSWVNELGKEAFLSASGRLSMINATNGKWTAPSDGTIIPAHLTKQLDIPSGGINLNRAAGANAAKAGGGMSGVVKAIRGAMGGDTFNQSVTVQSANPTQTANNMMVQMQRLRRGRR